MKGRVSSFGQFLIEDGKREVGGSLRVIARELRRGKLWTGMVFSGTCSD